MYCRAGVVHVLPWPPCVLRRTAECHESASSIKVTIYGRITLIGEVPLVSGPDVRLFSARISHTEPVGELELQLRA